MRNDTRNVNEQQAEERPGYETPRIAVMSEEEILKSFQVSQAGITWWTM